MLPKVLLVDDREDNLLSLESILEPSGYQFVKASSGRQALKILLNEMDFALILMDVQMPGMNGFETAALIYERERLRHIPIVFITAHNAGEEHIFRAYQAGAVDYIYKPVNPDLLRAKIHVFIDLYKKNHQLVQQEHKLQTINLSLEREVEERKSSEHQVRELNRKLLENIDQLEAANKELDGFAFMASHDMQEPLRKIHTFCDLLSTRLGPAAGEDSRKYLSSIRKAANRLQALIKDLLALSKISKDEDFLASCDLNKVLGAVIRELDWKIKEKNARILVDPLPSIPGNRNLLESMFSNLVENALKYSKEGTPPVIAIRYQEVIPVITEGREAPRRDFCRVLVQDNGIGFEQKYAEHIFSMFRRLHNPDEFDGTGIGLALCKKIVDRHNGYISAQSEPNKGSTFIVSLPAYAVRTAAAVV